MVSKKLRDKLPAGAVVSAELQSVARSFIELQRARHLADYDPALRSKRQITLGLIEQTEAAFEDWANASTDPLRPAFLLMLLTGDSILKDR